MINHILGFQIENLNQITAEFLLHIPGEIKHNFVGNIALSKILYILI
jgi:hypothetical protein